MQRWLIVAGSTLMLFGGLICSLLGWICLSINGLSISVAEIRKELELVQPQQVLQSVHQLETRVTSLETSH